MKESLPQYLAMMHDNLDQGIPMQWSERQGSYIEDSREVPELYAFSDNDETFRVYTDGSIDRFDNASISIEDLEATAIAVLSALAKAYEIQKGER